MDDKERYSLITMKIVGQWCFDLGRNFLVLLVAFGLFSPATQGTYARPVILILTVIAVFGALEVAKSMMEKIDEQMHQNKQYHKSKDR